jgi:hypothetical protein
VTGPAAFIWRAQARFWEIDKPLLRPTSLAVSSQYGRQGAAGCRSGHLPFQPCIRSAALGRPECIRSRYLRSDRQTLDSTTYLDASQTSADVTLIGSNQDFVQAVASYQSNNSGFHPTTANSMPTDSALQTSIAASCQPHA